MSTKPRFNPKAIWQYLVGGPGHIRQVLSEQGPTAASRSARYYSIALWLTMIAVYFLLACALGIFQVQMYNSPGGLDLMNPSVLAGIVLTGLLDLGAALAAAWAAVLAIMALFNPGEPKVPAFNALIWGIALVIFYAGFFAGILGYTG